MAQTITLGGIIRSDINATSYQGQRAVSLRFKCGKSDNVTAVALGHLAEQIALGYTNGSKLYVKGQIAMINLGKITQSKQHVIFQILEILPVDELKEEYVNRVELMGTIEAIKNTEKGIECTVRFPIPGNSKFSMHAQAQHRAAGSARVGANYFIQGYINNRYEYHPQFKNKVTSETNIISIQSISPASGGRTQQHSL